VSSARGPRVTAAVSGVSSDSLLLHPVEAHGMPASHVGVTRTAVEYVVGERAYRLTGDLSGHAEGQWRFVPRSSPVLLERREHLRTAVEVVIVLSSEDGIRHVGRTRDLSGGGVLAGFAEQLAVGTRLQFALVSRVGTEVIRGTCRVVRGAAANEVALAFEDVTTELLAQVADFILRHRGR
jgi:PilZ domain